MRGVGPSAEARGIGDNMNHTPGPWKLQYVYRGAFQIVSRSGDGEFVIADRSTVARRAVESTANGRLLAAAPDLLKACKMAFFDRQHDALSVVLKAAIQKAEPDFGQ